LQVQKVQIGFSTDHSMQLLPRLSRFTYQMDDGNKSFNSSSKRFDGKLDMKELFNREPGPGTYSMATMDS